MNVFAFDIDIMFNLLLLLHFVICYLYHENFPLSSIFVIRIFRKILI